MSERTAVTLRSLSNCNGTLVSEWIEKHKQSLDDHHSKPLQNFSKTAINRLTYGLIGGLIALISWLIFGLIGGLIFGLTSGLIGGVIGNKIQTDESLKLSFKKSLNGLILGLIWVNKEVTNTRN